MPSYTINTWLDGANKIQVGTEEVDAEAGTDVITWVATPSDASWKFVGITFGSHGAGTSLTVDSIQDHTLTVTDVDSVSSTETISYTLYVTDGGTTYDSDPFIVNRPPPG
ncbi:MAG: hypothetical protein AAGN66_10500 [Acidobacteriota bacterium]